MAVSFYIRSEGVTLDKEEDNGGKFHCEILDKEYFVRLEVLCFGNNKKKNVLAIIYSSLSSAATCCSQPLLENPDLGRGVLASFKGHLKSFLDVHDVMEILQSVRFIKSF